MRATKFFVSAVAACFICMGCTHLSAKLVKQQGGFFYDPDGETVEKGYDLCKRKKPIVFVRESRTMDGSVQLSLGAEMDKPIEWVGYTFETTDKDYPDDKTKNHISRFCLIDATHDAAGAPISQTVLPDTEYCREMDPPSSPKLIQLEMSGLTTTMLNLSKLKVMSQEVGGKTQSCEVEILIQNPYNLGPFGPRVP